MSDLVASCMNNLFVRSTDLLSLDLQIFQPRHSSQRGDDVVQRGAVETSADLIQEEGPATAHVLRGTGKCGKPDKWKCGNQISGMRSEMLVIVLHIQGLILPKLYLK